MKKDLWVYLFLIFAISFSSLVIYLVQSNKLEVKEGNIVVNKKNIDTSVFRDKLKEKVSPKEYTIPIVMYHYVEVVTDERDFIRESLAITPSAFESQILYLKDKGYEFIFMKELPDLIKKNKDLDKKYVAFTFDDGYRDFYTDAYPILKKHNVKSTVYLVNGFIDKPNYLLTEQIKEIQKSGLVEFGSHTVYHYNLPYISDENAKWEIEEGKKYLEKYLGASVYSFAYPYGDYDTDSIEMVYNAGFTTAVTTDHGVTYTKDSIFKLPRIRSGYIYTYMK